MRQQWCPGRFSSPPQKRPGNEAKRVRDRPGARAAELEVGTYYCACTIRTKWRLIHPETPVELPVSLFDSLAEFICSKGSSSVGYRVDWCKNHRLQSNQFVGRRDEEEEEKDGG